MKNLIIPLLLLFTIISSAQTGYLVVVTDSLNHISTFKTENYRKVSDRYEQCFGIKVDIDKKLNKSFFFEDRTQNCTFYCESKRIVYTGRGKVKYKKRKKNRS